jgi:hypothetical protein
MDIIILILHLITIAIEMLNLHIALRDSRNRNK